MWQWTALTPGRIQSCSSSMSTMCRTQSQAARRMDFRLTDSSGATRSTAGIITRARTLHGGCPACASAFRCAMCCASTTSAALTNTTRSRTARLSAAQLYRKLRRLHRHPRQRDDHRMVPLDQKRRTQNGKSLPVRQAYAGTAVIPLLYLACYAQQRQAVRDSYAGLSGTWQ